MKTKIFILISLTSLLGLGVLRADVVFSEDFQSLASGENIHANMDKVSFNDNSTSSGNTMTATLDTENLFGEGTSNLFNRVIDASGTSQRINANNIGDFDVATYSWDFNDRGTSGTYAFRLGRNNASLSGNYSVQAELGQGRINGVEAYEMNTTYRVDIVANTSDSTVNFTDGNGDSRSVEANHFSIFLTSPDRGSQTVVQDNVAFNGPVTEFGFQAIAFQTFNAADGIDFAWNNVTLRDEAVVTPVTP